MQGFLAHSYIFCGKPFFSSGVPLLDRAAGFLQLGILPVEIAFVHFRTSAGFQRRLEQVGNLTDGLRIVRQGGVFRLVGRTVYEVCKLLRQLVVELLEEVVHPLRQRTVCAHKLQNRLLVGQDHRNCIAHDFLNRFVSGERLSPLLIQRLHGGDPLLNSAALSLRQRLIQLALLQLVQHKIGQQPVCVGVLALDLVRQLMDGEKHIRPALRIQRDMNRYEREHIHICAKESAQHRLTLHFANKRAGHFSQPFGDVRVIIGHVKLSKSVQKIGERLNGTVEVGDSLIERLNVQPGDRPHRAVETADGAVQPRKVDFVDLGQNAFGLGNDSDAFICKRLQIAKHCVQTRRVDGRDRSLNLVKRAHDLWNQYCSSQNDCQRQRKQCDDQNAQQYRLTALRLPLLQKQIPYLGQRCLLRTGLQLYRRTMEFQELSLHSFASK